jgi:group I intron endonuclease
LLKYGYSSFKLDILEYCDCTDIVEREQYYLDHLEPKYNTLKIARSLAGFKHSAAVIKRISETKLGRVRSEATKAKLSYNTQSHAIIAREISTGNIKLFPSIRKTADFIGMHHSYLAKCLKANKIYVGKGYIIRSKKN